MKYKYKYKTRKNKKQKGSGTTTGIKIQTNDVKTLEGMTLGDVATPAELELLKYKDKKKP